MSLLEGIRSQLRPLGPGGRTLDLGAWKLRLEGIPADLADVLDRRWGGFVSSPCQATVSVRLVDAGERLFLDRWKRGERYRIRTDLEEGAPVVRSYNFAIWPAPGPEPDRWMATLRLDGGERPGRVVENVVRSVAARRAVGLGGLALHAAGVLRHGGAWVFAGPSGAGKTTVVEMSAPSPCLGDDLALVLPGPRGWVVASTPFDNRERSPADPPIGTFPLRGIWRLAQASEHRLEDLEGLRRESTVLGCVTMSPLYPDLGDALLDNARALCGAVPVGRLHFRRDAGFWRLLEDPAGTPSP